MWSARMMAFLVPRDHLSIALVFRPAIYTNQVPYNAPAMNGRAEHPNRRSVSDENILFRMYSIQLYVYILARM